MKKNIKIFSRIGLKKFYLGGKFNKLSVGSKIKKTGSIFRKVNLGGLFDKLKDFLSNFHLFKAFQKIKVRLILSFMVPVILIITLGVVSFRKAEGGLRESYENSTSSALVMASDYLKLGMESVESAEKQFCSDESLQRYYRGFYDTDPIQKRTTGAAMKKAINAKVVTDKFVSRIFLFSDVNGAMSTVDEIQDNFYEGFMETELSQKMMEKQMEPIWVGHDDFLDTTIGIGADQYAIRLIRKIPGSNAIIIVDMNIEKVMDILGETKSDETAIICMVTEDGKEIVPMITEEGIENDNKEETTPTKAGEEPVEAGEELTETIAPIITDKEFYQTALNSEELQGMEYITYNKQNYAMVYSKIGDSGAIIFELVPERVIVSQADDIKKVTIVLVIISAIVAICVAGIISSGIERVIKKIIDKLKIAAKGDLTVDFSIKRNDEFKILIDEIKRTFLNVKDLIQQVNQLSMEVSTSSDQVKNTAVEFYKSSKDISEAMDEIESGVMQEAHDAEECLTQMDSLSKKIVLVGDNTKEIGNIADDTKRSVHDGTVTTEDLNKNTKDTADITNLIINQIQNLEKKSSTINEIINVINDIADQTTLLSLNASIEAARAGDAGRGFAVVANEIRTLSDKSKQSVDNIKKIIEGIQNDTRTAVDITIRAKDIVHNQENSVKNTTESYWKINQAVERLIEFLKHIQKNVEDIEDTRVSTLTAIESISAVLQQVAASANDVNHSADEQLASVDLLNKSAGSLYDNSEVLVEAVERFKI